jgi:cell wall-associated NlpC family hydrolase
VHASAAGVLATAKRYVGTDYRYGGESPVSGFDCSGFVQYVYSRNGIQLPRTSRQQASSGKAVPLGVASLRPGDLLLFASSGTTVNHVAIYVGDNRILHSSAGAGGVVYDDLSTPRGKWYLQRHVGGGHYFFSHPPDRHRLTRSPDPSHGASEYAPHRATRDRSRTS